MIHGVLLSICSKSSRAVNCSRMSAHHAPFLSFALSHDGHGRMHHCIVMHLHRGMMHCTQHYGKRSAPIYIHMVDWHCFCQSSSMPDVRHDWKLAHGLSAMRGGAGRVVTQQPTGRCALKESVTYNLQPQHGLRRSDAGRRL